MSRKGSRATSGGAPSHGSPGDAVIFYDGVCGLCDRSVQFTLRNDPKGHFRFAPLQGPFAASALARHGKDACDLDSVYVLVDAGRPSERLLERADAVMYILEAIGGVWQLSAAGRVLPRSLRDGMYDFIARRRYRWFGRHGECVLPAPTQRERFIDTV